eukprot:6567409-Pyramimonas_sp.AAC.1
MNVPTSTLQAPQQTNQRTGGNNLDSSSGSGQGAISRGPRPGPAVACHSRDAGRHPQENGVQHSTPSRHHG